MSEFPALPLWTDAYLADTAHLSYEEHGFYFHILMTMWRTPGCQMPNDTVWIDKRFRGNAAAVLALCTEFCTLSEDRKWWHQKRLRKQWAWCREKSAQNAEKANYRWSKGKAACNGNADAMLLNLNLNLNPKRKEDKNWNSGKKEGFRTSPHTPQFQSWYEYYVTNCHRAMLRELESRKQSGQSFDFPQEWPPNHQPAKSKREASMSDRRT